MSPEQRAAKIHRLSIKNSEAAHASFMEYLSNNGVQLLSEDIVQYCKVQMLARGSFLFKDGDLHKHLWFVSTGAVTLQTEYDGNRVVSNFYFDKMLCNTISELKHKTEYSAQCMEKTTVIGIKQESLNKLCLKYPSLAEFLMKHHLQAFRFAQHRVQSFQVMSAQERYCEYVDPYPELLQRFNLGDVANYLGIRQETLSRLRRVACRKDFYAKAW